MKRENVSFSIRELMPVIIEQLENGQEVSLKVKGNSMQPLLRDDRDSIIMKSPNTRTPQVGDLFMFCRKDGSYAMHRICRVNHDGSYDFVGDNQFLIDYGIAGNMLVAYVPRVIRKGKETNCEKGLGRYIMTKRMQIRIKHPNMIRRINRTTWLLKWAVRHPFGTIKKLCKKIQGK